MYLCVRQYQWRKSFEWLNADLSAHFSREDNLKCQGLQFGSSPYNTPRALRLQMTYFDLRCRTSGIFVRSRILD